jgi:hypothetical protein
VSPNRRAGYRHLKVAPDHQFQHIAADHVDSAVAFEQRTESSLLKQVVGFGSQDDIDLRESLLFGGIHGPATYCLAGARVYHFAGFDR